MKGLGMQSTARRARRDAGRLAAIVAAGAVLVLAAVAGAAAGATVDQTRKVVRARWTLVGVGREHRSLRVLYLVGGCLDGDAWATVRETPARIHVRLLQHETIPPSGVCPLDIGFTPFVIRLNGSVGGRPIHGWGPVAIHAFPPFGPRSVPRVTQLSAGDAARVLHVRGLRARFRGRPSREVIRERPRPGSVVPRRSTVRLRTVGSAGVGATPRALGSRARSAPRPRTAASR